MGVLIGGQQFAGGALQPLIGPLADRYPKRKMAAFGTLLVVVAYFTGAFSSNYWILLIAFIFGAGTGSAITQVIAAATQVQVGRTLGQSTVASLLSMAFATGILIGSLGGGIVAELSSRRATFALAGCVVLLGYLIYSHRSSKAADST